MTFELAGAAADATDGAFIMDVAFPLTGAAADVVAAAALELVEATVEVVFDTAKNSRGFEASASRRARRCPSLPLTAIIKSAKIKTDFIAIF